VTTFIAHIMLTDCEQRGGMEREREVQASGNPRTEEDLEGRLGKKEGGAPRILDAIYESARPGHEVRLNG